MSSAGNSLKSRRSSEIILGFVQGFSREPAPQFRSDTILGSSNFWVSREPKLFGTSPSPSEEVSHGAASVTVLEAVPSWYISICVLPDEHLRDSLIEFFGFCVSPDEQLGALCIPTRSFVFSVANTGRRS